VLFVPGNKSPDHHDVARLVTLGVLGEVVEELALVAQLDALGRQGRVDVEPSGHATRKVDERLDTASRHLSDAIEVERAVDAAPRLPFGTPPGAARSLESIGEEIDA